MIVTKEMGAVLADTTITSGDPVFLDVERSPFKLHGFCESFARLPFDVVKNANDNAKKYASVGAGGRLRFKTNSDYIVVHAEIDYRELPGTMSYLACQSFDFYFYKDGKYTFGGASDPSQGAGKSYIECRLRFSDEMKDVLINFPLLSSVKKMYVALREGCVLEAPSEYKYKTPVVFYGSSIVHGVGAGRAGMAYPLIISRMLDTDIKNIGLSGGALAESEIIDYISTLDMSVFVYDYDHNAPSVEFLRDTHYAGYKRFRSARPDVPIILASKPDYWADPKENEERRKIILDTYKRALNEGDKRVTFVDGKTMYDPDLISECTVDNCHPNDAGYIAMAKKIGNEIKKYIG